MNPWKQLRHDLKGILADKFIYLALLLSERDDEKREIAAIIAMRAARLLSRPPRAGKSQ